MQSFKCRPRDKARAVVHTRFSLDVEPIDAFQSLVEALSVVQATGVAETPVKPAQTPSARILRDVYEAEVDRLRAKLAVVPARGLNHRQKSALVQIQAKAEPVEQAHAAYEARVHLGEAVEPDLNRGFPANFKTEQKWKAPGVRQETTVRRFKRFGIKN